MDTDILYRLRPDLKMTQEIPSCFGDLHLDFIRDSMISGKASMELNCYFQKPLNNIGDIIYRQDVFRDLENPGLVEAFTSFVNGMGKLEEEMRLVDQLNYIRQKEAFLLEAVLHYCTLICQINDGLAQFGLESKALGKVKDYIGDYIRSGPFMEMHEKAARLSGMIRQISYSVYIKDNHVTVGRLSEKKDYCLKAASLFADWISNDKGNVKSRSFGSGIQMNQVEVRIFDYVVKLYPDIFKQLSDFCQKYSDYKDMEIVSFYRDIQFYLLWLSFIEPLKNKGLPFCYPVISDEGKICNAEQCFDISLAAKLLSAENDIVTNDFSYQDGERILIVTGPNQGGKTTFARMVGQVFYLASLGLPVPGLSARLFLCTQIFTHFEKKEVLDTAQGKLRDDIERIHSILTTADSNSLLIMNETFSSTTLSDAVCLGKEIISQILLKDMLCVYVTFIDELTRGISGTVSMVSGIDPYDTSRKTYKVTRRPSDGKAYAMAIAEKYNLSYAQIMERIKG
jgi:hypothetical protein